MGQRHDPPVINHQTPSTYFDHAHVSTELRFISWRKQFSPFFPPVLFLKYPRD